MIIGLTGGIACGKSIVSNALSLTGLRVIDADILAREAVAVGSPALVEIRSLFGDEVFNNDGSLNRKKLASRVFSTPKDKLHLEAILHPIIKKRIKEEIDRARNENEDLVVCAPLLIEANLIDLVDTVWVVRSDTKTMIKRICERDKLTEIEAIKRIQAQMPIEEKLDYADYIIDNDGSVNELLEATRATLELTRLTSAHDALCREEGN